MKPLKIRITGTLNSESTITELNKALSTLESRMDKLKLSVQLDSKVLKTLNDFSKAMENHKKIAQDLNRVTKEEKTVTKEADGTVREKIRQHLKSGEIIQKETTKINENIKATRKQAQETSKLTDEVNKLGEAQKRVTKFDGSGKQVGGSQTFGDNFKNSTVSYNNRNQVVGQRTVENFKQQELAIEKVRQKLNQLNSAGIITNSSLSRMSTALNAAQTEKELNRVASALSRIESSSKVREKNKELEHQLSLYQQQAKINVQNLQRRYGNAIGDDGARALNNYLNSVNRLNSQTPYLNRQMQQLNTQFRQISSNVNAASSHVASFGSQLMTAMQRIPIWSIGMSSFYLPLRGLQDALTQIIEIDSQLTVLERVSNGQIDINNALQESVRIADELGNKIAEVNDGLTNFARSGFRGEDLYALTEVATLMGNVSDLSVDESASSLIAAVKGFGIAATDAITVVDKLNEIDNNFAVTTNDLSQVLRKATGAANTFGVGMDTMLGHATAISQITRESGNIIGNSLKTLYSRVTTMDRSAEVLQSVGISIRNLSGEMRPVEDILDELSSKWSSLNAEQQQGLGIQLAGRYQLSRFLVLMQQQSESLKARAAALDSEGSAYAENQAYLDSYEAKINALSNAWTNFTQVAGEDILGSSIVVATEGLSTLANTTSFLVDNFGLLPPLFGIAGASLLALNSNIRNSITQNGILSSSLVRTGDSMSIATGRARLYQTQLYNVTLAARAASGALTTMGTVSKGVFSFLVSAALPIAGFMALGAAISYVTNKLVEHKKEQKEVKDELDKLSRTYSDNELQINALVGKYEELENKVNSGSLSANDEEYLGVMQDIYELLPNVAESVDDKGQAHLRSADAIKKEIGYLKDLSMIDAEKFITDFQSKLTDLNKQIQETQDQLDEISNRQDNGYKGIMPFFGLREKAQLDDMANSVIGQRDIDAKLEERKRLFQDLGNSYAQYYGVQSKIKESDIDYIGTIVAKNQKLLDSKKGISEVENQVKSYIGSIGEIRTVSGDLFDTDRIQTITKYNSELVSVFNDMSTKFKKGNTDWADYETKLSNAGLATNEVESIMNLLTTGVDEATGATLAYNDASEEQIETEEEKISVTERLLGYDREKLDSLYELIGTYKILSAVENDSKTKSEELQSITEQLAATYPHLVKGKKINIEAIEKEAAAQDILLKASEDLLKGTLTVEQQKSATTAIQAKKRIDILKQELAAQNQIVQKFNELSKTLADNANTLEQEKLATRAYQRSKDLVAAIDIEMPDFNSQIDALASSIDYQGRAAESSKSANEKAAKEYENSTYVSDKFKQAVEKVNFELEKQNAIQNQFPTHSKKYQDSLKKELSLLEKKKDLLEAQSKSLEKQIKSGKIQQTGIITTSSPTATTVSTSSRSGSYSGQYASIINQAASKYGVDANLVAAIIKAESGFNSNARSHAGAMGLMQLMPGTARGLGVSNAYDPYQNIMGGTKYIKQMLDANNGNIQLALASYNAGLGNVRKYGGIPPFAETQKYVPKVLGYYNSYGGSGAFTASASPSSSSNKSKEVAENLSNVDNAKSELIQMQQDLLSIEAEIQQLYMDIIDAQLSSFDRVKDSYNDDLSKIDLIQKREISTSNEWIKQQLNKEKIVTKQIDQQKKSIDFLKKQIKSNKDLNAAQKSLLEDQLVDRYQELYSLESNLLDERISMADQIVDTYKKAAEAQKNAAISAIDEMINEINKDADEADYKKRLEKAQKERQDLLDEIALLSLDDSFTAEKRIAELTKQLQEQEESIDEMQETKSREDRIDNLNKEKETIESNYDNLINDERKFNKMRSDIINANSKQIQKDLDKYYKNIKDNANVLGKSLSNNLIDLINQANKYLNGKDYKPIKVAQAKDGGLLPNWGSQGKSMVVHEGELISNKPDTKALFQVTDMAKSIVSKFTSIPKFPSNAITTPGGNSGSRVTVVIEGNVYGEKHLETRIKQVATNELFGKAITGVKILGGNI
ncbi:phage tail tape measure protein [Cytobacillus kochii]|uniref:phage tail tape measure protein n=1 Tax=Cytobacillus kochii TaxID=859143 RepID=UPI00296EA2DD|nr:phage tail tape measure protein [Cytobacillus kochii]